MWNSKIKEKVLKVCLTIYFWSISVAALLVTFPLYLIMYPFINQKSSARFYEFFPGFIILNAMLVPGFWKLKFRDLRTDKSWDNKRYVVIANHLSFIDSLILSTFPLKKKYMMGKIFSKIPIFGTMAKFSGYIPVDRNEPNQMKDLAKSGVHRAVETIRDGSSFVLYPEGMRNPNPHQLLPFKTGAYYIAFMSDVPILPVCIKGTNHAMPIGNPLSWVNFAEITVTIGEPFSVEAPEDIPKLVTQTQEFIYHYI